MGSGTFSDLNHLLGGVESSDLFLGGQDTTLDIVDGCIGPRGNIFGGERTLGTSPELGK